MGLDAGLINCALQAQDIADSREDQGEGRRKKNSVDEAADLAIDSKLREFRDKEMAGDLEDTPVGNTRSVEGLRKMAVKRLMAQGKDGTCRQCSAVTKKITLYKSRFIYEGVKICNDNIGSKEPDILGYSKTASSRGGTEVREKTELNPTELRNHFRLVSSFKIMAF